jgi:hypothetical protein
VTCTTSQSPLCQVPTDVLEHILLNVVDGAQDIFRGDCKAYKKVKADEEAHDALRDELGHGRLVCRRFYYLSWKAAARVLESVALDICSGESMATLQKIPMHKKLVPWINRLQVTCFYYDYEPRSFFAFGRRRRPDFWFPEAWDWTCDLGWRETSSSTNILHQ